MKKNFVVSFNGCMVFKTADRQKALDIIDALSADNLQLVDPRYSSCSAIQLGVEFETEMAPAQ